MVVTSSPGISFLITTVSLRSSDIPIAASSDGISRVSSSALAAIILCFEIFIFAALGVCLCCAIYRRKFPYLCYKFADLGFGSCNIYRWERKDCCLRNSFSLLENRNKTQENENAKIVVPGILENSVYSDCKSLCNFASRSICLIIKKIKNVDS